MELHRAKAFLATNPPWVIHKGRLHLCEEGRLVSFLELITEDVVVVLIELLNQLFTFRTKYLHISTKK